MNQLMIVQITQFKTAVTVYIVKDLNHISLNFVLQYFKGKTIYLVMFKVIDIAIVMDKVMDIL